MRTVIIGCGYAGLPLGQRLVAAGHEVFGVRRSMEARSELEQAGITPILADIARDVTGLPAPVDWAVNLVSTKGGGGDAYRKVYLEGARSLIGHYGNGRVSRYVHVSSTSVYGQRDGEWVDEESETLPASETSAVLLETERELMSAAERESFPAIILRSAGIYGPGRGHLYKQFLAGDAVIRGEGKRMLNMVHRDDLVTAIIAALERGRPGGIYNVTDNEPVSEAEFFRWLARALDRPMPPAIAERELAGRKRKRGGTNKRVSNRRLREELRWNPEYPSYREGYAAAVKEAVKGGAA